MAPRHSVSPAATPYQHSQSTTAQLAVEHSRKSAHTRILGGDGSGASDGASTGVGGADVSDEDSCSEDMSVDDEGGDENCRPRHHVTGTLPFVAIELLTNADRGKEGTHALHHDLESVFWVLLYICIKHHEGTGTYFSHVLEGMTSPDPHRVRIEKTALVAQDGPLYDMPLGGKFRDLKRFLRKFGELCRRKEGKVIEAFEVEALVSEELQKIRKKRTPRGTKRRPKNPPEHGPAPATKKLAKRPTE